MGHKTSETFDDLMANLASDETWTSFAQRAGVSTRIVELWRAVGTKRPHALTIRAVASALRCEDQRVRDAVAESYRQASRSSVS